MMMQLLYVQRTMKMMKCGDVVEEVQRNDEAGGRCGITVLMI